MAEKLDAKRNIEAVVLWKWNVVCNCTYDPDNDYKYEIYNWESEDVAQPSSTKIDAACAEYQVILDAKHHQLERKYPLLGEQLDMLWHDINDGKLDNTGSFYTTLKKVKDDNPKSE